MKIANAPGRKNDRRKRALAQLRRAHDTKAARLDRPPGFSRAAEIANLERLIVPDMVARSVRTKKNRTDRAKIAH